MLRIINCNAGIRVSAERNFATALVEGSDRHLNYRYDVVGSVLQGRAGDFVGVCLVFEDTPEDIEVSAFGLDGKRSTLICLRVSAYLFRSRPSRAAVARRSQHDRRQ